VPMSSRARPCWGKSIVKTTLSSSWIIIKYLMDMLTPLFLLPCGEAYQRQPCKMGNITQPTPLHRDPKNAQNYGLPPSSLRPLRLCVSIFTPGRYQLESANCQDVERIRQAPRPERMLPVCCSRVATFVAN
jgi:hypothetical protein